MASVNALESATISDVPTIGSPYCPVGRSLYMPYALAGASDAAVASLEAVSVSEVAAIRLASRNASGAEAVTVSEAVALVRPSLNVAGAESTVAISVAAVFVVVPVLVNASESVAVNDTGVASAGVRFAAATDQVSVSDGAAIGIGSVRQVGDITVTVDRIYRPASLNRTTRVLGASIVRGHFTLIPLSLDRFGRRAQGVPTLSGRVSPGGLARQRGLGDPEVNLEFVQAPPISRAGGVIVALVVSG